MQLSWTKALRHLVQRLNPSLFLWTGIFFPRPQGWHNNLIVCTHLMA